MKRVYVIILALDGKVFDHYLTKPQIFYDNYENAQTIIAKLIEEKEYLPSQLKIHHLWKQEEK